MSVTYFMVRYRILDDIVCVWDI